MRPTITASCLSFAWVLAGGALGTADVGAQVVEPSVRAVRVATPPTLDGRLDDAAWRLAEAITDFRQRDPDQGAHGTESTSVWVVYDETSLYVGARLSDQQPQAIGARDLRRDSDFDSDDTFSVILDTYHDHRNGFVFRVNPNGAMFDGVVRNESNPDSDWDEQWFAAAVIGTDGWTVELQIPFKALRFAPGPSQIWGIDFERIIRRKNEDLYWANWDRDFAFEQVSQAGILLGLEDIRRGQRVRLRPYAVGGVESLAATATSPRAQAVGDIGIDDLKIALTPNLTADVAINPDFAQTETDEQRVNLTRFSQFFPEKRQFFIEGADSLRMSAPSGQFDDSFELFHSRQVGLSESGEPITILAGAKLTGKVGGTDLGVFGARTGSQDGRPGETFGVARFRRDVFGRSYVGAIATVRDGVDRPRTTLGADARFVIRKYLTLSALAGSTDDGVTPRQLAHFYSAAWDADLFSAEVAHLDVDPEFDPAIGYVRRRDRQTSIGFDVSPRPRRGPVRQFQFSPSVVVNRGPDGLVLTREVEFRTEADLQSGDSLQFAVQQTREHLPEPFEITDGIVLPVRQYDWNSVQMEVETFDGRRVSGSVSVEIGGFYTGTRRSLEVSTTVLAGQHLSVSPDYEVNDIALAEGAFRTHLFGLRANISFTRNLLTSAFLQYNSEGDLASIQLRANYIIKNLDNLYFVYNESRFTGAEFAGRANRTLMAKITYSLHR